MASGSTTAGEETGYDFVGEISGWVEAYIECPHLHHLNGVTQSLPQFDALCSVCKNPNENWLCLCCHEVFCSRFINGHMLAHFKDANHPLAAGFRDLSVWCFECDHYLDAQVISQLRPIFEALHLMKFGDPAPPRADIFFFVR
uniref:UBP-type domain-containing protein n=1 Tax=Physcomitrium patens TaxID=3218 RepID=A0A7I4DZI8_PHYPA